MTKYAPANDDGEKPYVIEVFDWGRTYNLIGWGATAAEAKRDALGRPATGIYAISAHRATPEDLDE